MDEAGSKLGWMDEQELVIDWLVCWSMVDGVLLDHSVWGSMVCWSAEAELIGRIDRTGHQPGEDLGPLGAVLVAETLLGLLELDEHSYLGSNRDWSPSLAVNGYFTMTTLLDKAQTAA